MLNQEIENKVVDEVVSTGEEIVQNAVKESIMDTTGGKVLVYTSLTATGLGVLYLGYKGVKKAYGAVKGWFTNRKDNKTEKATEETHVTEENSSTNEE